MFKSIGTTLFAGFITLLPVVLTIYLLVWLAVSSEQVLGGALQWILPDLIYFPGLGMIVGLVLVFFVGFLMKAIFIRQLFTFSERLLYRLPFIKTVYRVMRDLLDEFDQNPVLVSGAYNAGPNAVKRWLRTRPTGEAAIWIETLPYYETRDYIPRVLAFTTIYDWRMGGDLKRISSRMPHIESGKIGVKGYTDVVCRD